MTLNAVVVGDSRFSVFYLEFGNLQLLTILWLVSCLSECFEIQQRKRNKYIVRS